MSANTPSAARVLASAEVDYGVFLAVVITADRQHVLRELTHQAVAHFGRDLLFVRNVCVSATDAGASWLATADFSLSSFTD